MSIVFPSGSKRYNWIPKLAEDEKLGTEALSDEELKSLITPSGVDTAEVAVGPAGEAPAASAVEVAVEAPKADEPKVDLPPVDAAPATPAAAAVEKVEQAVDDAKAALDELKDVVELNVAEDGTVAIEDEVPEEVSVELESETPGEVAVEVETPAGEAAEGEAHESAETPAEEKKEHELMESAAKNQFVKVAALSKENKKKLHDYWVNILGYDPKYVAYMITDYE